MTDFTVLKAKDVQKLTNLSNSKSAKLLTEIRKHYNKKMICYSHFKKYLS